MAVAGAGSGKTRVLTNRISYLIEEIGVPPSRILAITFTNKAAEEMRNRVFKMTESNLSGIWISTFHSMGAKILRFDIHHLGYKNDFQIIDDDDQQIIIKRLMKDHNYDPKRFSPRAIASIFERGKAAPKHCCGLEEPIGSVARLLFQEYQDFLFQNNLVDFQDLVGSRDSTVPGISRRLGQISTIGLNTSSSMSSKTRTICNTKSFICWRRTTRTSSSSATKTKAFTRFAAPTSPTSASSCSDYPNPQTIILNQNYRSTNRILDGGERT
ncbi:MAG: UvrD-helicase domain-containing protein [Bacillus subtilis]|nr:UvrD-helicase domain-containing protein [Bacillus subtilis]